MRSHGLGGGGWRALHFNWKKLRQARKHTTKASSGDASLSNNSYFNRVKGYQGVLKAALTSGTLSATGDLLAQFCISQSNAKDGLPPHKYDAMRTMRMFGYGFCWYGPCQYYWYNLLDWMMPIKTTKTFLSKVTLNQLILAPITLTTVFAWNLALSNQSEKIADKISTDLWPTMMNGWKFWIPAASINFYAIPIEKQVLYMSACGVLWTAYLSYASATRIAAPEPAPEPVKSCCAGKCAK